MKNGREHNSIESAARSQENIPLPLDKSERFFSNLTTMPHLTQQLSMNPHNKHT